MDVSESTSTVAGVDALQAPIRGSFNLRRFSGDAALVIGAGVIANLFFYVFHFVLSRRLGPDLYGTLATMTSIASMLGVLGTSLGTVAMQEAAFMWASHLDSAIAPFLRRAGSLVLALAALVSLALIVASMPLRSYLHVSQPLLWWLLAAYVAIALFAGFVRGAAQGAHRFGVFAASLISEGVFRVMIAFALVAMGYGVAGALGGIIVSAGIAVVIVAAPMLFGGEKRAWTNEEHLRLGGEALKVLGVTAAVMSLLYIDMLFAKHSFSGNVAGYFGAAGTVARTIPFGVGLISLIVMPKAAAARHASRDSLAHVLLLAGAVGAFAVVAGFLLIALFGRTIIGVTYGPAFADAVPMLRVYALDEALLALWAVAMGYLVAVKRYTIFVFLASAVVLEAAGFALFGSTPLRLLSIAVIANALLVPVAWTLALRTLRDAPQASEPSSAKTST